MASGHSGKRWIRRIAVTSIVTLILLAVVWTIWNWIGTRRVEEAVTALREAGLPGTLVEISDHLPGGDAPRPEENAAPIYAAAFALLDAVEKPEEGFLEVVEERFVVTEETRLALSRYGPALDLLHRAAERPRCRVELDWRQGFAVEMPHLPGTRDAAYLLAARALLRQETEDLEGALDDLHALFALGRSLREEPILISQLVRIAIDGVGLQVLEALLPGAPDPLAAIETVGLDDVGGCISRAFGTEAVVVLSLVSDPKAIGNLTDSAEPSWFFLVAGPHVKTDVARLCRYLTRMSLAAREPYPQGMARVRNLQREAEEGGGFMTALLLPSIGSCIEKEAEHVARTALARTAARCLAHRKEHGEYPSSTEDLPGTELDPLNGAPFLLTPGDEGVVLQSRASDGVRWILPAP